MAHFPFVTCDECGVETDVAREASCSCGLCKKNFCSSLFHDCFTLYHKKHRSCPGRPCEITNPKWIININRRNI